MTTNLLVKRVKRHAKIDGQLYRLLMSRVPPIPITSKRMHELYSMVVQDIVSMLVEGTIPAAEEAAIRVYVKSAAHFVDEYEQAKYPSPKSDPIELLKFLMEQHNLTQDDLADDLGGQSVVSELLSGKRKLTIDHVKRLSARFGVNPAAFIQ